METYTSQTLPKDFTGKCTYIHSKGTYTGDILRGRLTGVGEFTYKDGSKHVGTWVLGRFMSGIHVRADGFHELENNTKGYCERGMPYVAR